MTLVPVLAALELASPFADHAVLQAGRLQGSRLKNESGYPLAPFSVDLKKGSQAEK